MENIKRKLISEFINNSIPADKIKEIEDYIINKYSDCRIEKLGEDIVILDDFGRVIEIIDPIENINLSQPDPKFRPIFKKG